MVAVPDPDSSLRPRVYEADAYGKWGTTGLTDPVNLDDRVSNEGAGILETVGPNEVVDGAKVVEC